MSFRCVISVFFTIAVLIAARDLFAQNTAVKPAATPTLTPVTKSNSGLTSKVDYSAVDSIRFDVANQKMYLFGQAKVLYEDMELKADYIEFDMAKNIAFARGRRDSSGHPILDSMGMPIGEPVFKDGAKSFDARELTYSFKTKKGKIRDVTTKEGEAYIHAREAKKDTGDVYFIKNGRYTTCDLSHPHFYLQATKIKIIPDDKIVIGPAYLAVGDVPTPLGLPFGVFPNKKGRKSGVLIPAYGESELGFFLKDGGYYFGFSDYFDVALRADLYSKGSFGLKTNTNYAKRYKYTGFMGVSFAQLQFSEKEFKDYRESHEFFVRWNHAQDPKSNPTSRFSANVNLGSSDYQTYSSNTANEYLSNTFLSNVSWNKSWQGRPYNLSLNMTHSQTKRPRIDKKGMETFVDVAGPELAFTHNRMYLRGKNFSGKPNIFQKIGFSYSLNAKNQISTYDTLLFYPKSLELHEDVNKRLRNGLRANVPVSTSQNIGPVIMTISAAGNAYGYFQTYKRRKGFTLLGKDTMMTDTIKSFKPAFDYSTALSFSTKIYGMFSYKNAKVKAIRHVLTPTASFSYRPDFSEHKYGYYGNIQTVDTVFHPYSYFEGGVYGYPAAGKSAFLNFSLSNNLEMKLRPSKKDTTGADRKVVLIENLTIASAYNVAADSMKWAVINITGRTRVFKLVDLTLSGIIDPYFYDTTYKKRINKLELDTIGKLGTLTSAMFSLSTSLRSLVKKKDAKAKIPAQRMKGYHDELAYIQAHPEYYVDFNVPWDLSVFYNIVYAKPALEDTIIQSLTFNGNISVTQNWKVGFRSGFDFVNKDFTYTSFDVYRDLHCWEMRLNWIPFGFRKSYLLTIAVKASVLQDLKLNRKRDWYDYN